MLAATAWDFEEKAKAAVAQARNLPAADQAAFALYVADRVAQDEGLQMTLQPLLSGLLRKKLPFTSVQATALVEAICCSRFCGPLLPVLAVAGRVALTPELRAALQRLHAHPWMQSGYSDVAKPLAKVQELLGAAKPQAPTEHGPWMSSVLASIAGSDAEVPLRKLLALGAKITSGAPSKKWLSEANQLVDLVGRDAFRRLALDWLALGPSLAKPSLPVGPAEADQQRALLWALASFDDHGLCAAVARFTEQCLEKIPGVGPVCQKGGNAGVNALAAMGGEPALAQLTRLATRIRYATAQRLIAKALDQAAQRAGLSREELEERTVPDCGLDSQGRWTRRIGGYSAELDIRSPTLRFINADGKPLKSLPAALKADHADEVKQARAAAKEIAAMLAAHRLRIERLLLTGRRIPLAIWRQCYLDHPLLQDLARRLVWRFTSGDRDQTAIWADGRLEDWNGSPIEPDEEATVRLWHPIDADVQTVLAWRCRLEDSGVRQPFKQAHREVYILTDAERETRDHSNRFAAHILAQHQFAALAKARGWRFTLMGAWDSHNTPTLELPHAGLEARLHVDFVAEQAQSGHAVYLYISTDRVTFHRSGETHAAAIRIDRVGDPQRGHARRRSLHRRHQRRLRPRLDPGPLRRARRLLARGQLGRVDGHGSEPPRNSLAVAAAPPHRRSNHTRRPLPRHPRQARNLQDPPRQRKRLDGARRALPVHRPGRRAQSDAPLRRRPHALAHPEQSDVASQRLQDQRPVNPQPDAVALLLLHFELSATEALAQACAQGYAKSAYGTARSRPWDAACLKSCLTPVFTVWPATCHSPCMRTVVRSLLRDRAFSAIAIAMFALGIGATTVIFSLVNGILLRPLSHPEPDRLYGVYQHIPEVADTWGRLLVNGRHFDEWRRTCDPCESLGLFRYDAPNLSGDGPPVRIDGLRVTHDFLTALGTKPILGRAFLPADDVPGAEPVVLITGSFWRERYAADPEILGRRITINGRPVHDHRRSARVVPVRDRQFARSGLCPRPAPLPCPAAVGRLL